MSWEENAASLAISLVKIAADAVDKKATPEQTARELVLQAIAIGDIPALRALLDEAARARAEAVADTASQLKFGV